MSLGTKTRSISILTVSLFFLAWAPSISGQEDIMKAEKVYASFFSWTPVENIEAHNQKGQAVLNTETGELLFVITIRDFEFKKRLMQKHFNKQYMESDKYPEATFNGKLINWSGIPSSETVYTVEGTLEMHGVEQEISEKASLEPSGDGLTGKSTFSVLLKDYDIKVPKIVSRNIAEEIEVKVIASFNKSGS